MRTAEDYKGLLQAFLPPGRLWDALRETGSLADDLLAALAEEFARVDQRVDDLLDETDPRTTLEMLSEWEAWAGLPDACTGDFDTIQQRRGALVQHLTSVGGQSRAYFINLAASLGYTVTISEYRPFICGLNRCGDQLNGGVAVRHYWRVNVGTARIVWFRSGVSQAGDYLGLIDRAAVLECVLQRFKPAHTQIIFNYTGV